MKYKDMYLKEDVWGADFCEDFFGWYIDNDCGLHDTKAKTALKRFLSADAPEGIDRKVKEMVYTTERKREVLATGYYFGILYYILNLGTHPTAYVKIPETHWFYHLDDYDEFPIECHGGLTFLSDELHISEQEHIAGKFIGWDYAHAGDYSPYYEGTALADDGHKWTTDELLLEVREVCTQVVEAEKESPADKKFKELNYKKHEEGTRIAYEMGDFKIIFDLLEKNVAFYNQDEYSEISMEELKAINEKAKELGWHD